MVALITDVHYRMSPALVRSLAQRGVRVYTCEKSDFSALPGARSKYTLAHFKLQAKNYEDALTTLLIQLRHQEGCKPALLPVGAATLQMLADRRKHFEKYAGLCIGAPDTIALFNSKRELHRLAENIDIPCPRSFENEPYYPCVVKPICGEKLGLHAAQRYTIAYQKEEAEAAYQYFSALDGQKPILQEYLPGEGSGCSVIAVRGKIIAHIEHRRIREYPISGGPSSCCIAEKQPQLLQWAEKLIAATNFSGPAMFEFKSDADGRPRLLECNPRIWGSFPLTEAAQSTLPFAWFAAAWNAGNPKQTIQLPHNFFQEGKKMIFFPSDLMAAGKYLKEGSRKKSLEAFRDFLNPKISDGIFRWHDLRPALSYYTSFFRKRGKS